MSIVVWMPGWRGMLAGCVLSWGVTLPAGAAMDEELANYDHLSLDNIPGVGQVIQASLKALPRDLGEIRNWTTRMRLSALLPQIQARYRWFQDTVDQFDTVYRTKTHDESESRSEDRDQDELISRVHADPLESYVEEQNLNYGSDYRSHTSFRETDGPHSITLNDDVVWMDDYQIMATWNLSALLFTDDELQAAQVNRIVAEYRFKHMESVAGLYGKLQSALDTLSRTPANIRSKIQRDAAAAMLDAVTDGYLSGYVASRKPGAFAHGVGSAEDQGAEAVETMDDAVAAPVQKNSDPSLVVFGKKNMPGAAGDDGSGLRPSDIDEEDEDDVRP